HGLGLDIHEGPRISAVGPPLEEGMVVTVEPGLYYPGLGGCRIEDVVLVTADGCRNFNKASKELEV
ncbi:MAG: M24 family metallopeptidase, partial [Planctomycetota bacterium]